ncbi:MAG: ATP-binding cassette domain-containing protein, partial [Candidatus Bipolaricaulota bacterium]
MPLVEVHDLKTFFYTEDGVVKAVDGVSFAIEPERTLGVVGESGCGKSVTALSVMGLVPMPPGRIAGGQILFRRNGDQVDLTALNPKGREYRSIRGKEIAMIFQEPMTSLNPVMTIGRQIAEPLMVHLKMNHRQAW